MNIENTQIISGVLRRVFYEEHFDPQVARAVVAHFADEFSHLVPDFDRATFLRDSMAYYKIKPDLPQTYGGLNLRNERG